MKILILIRRGYRNSPGGDAVHALKTAHYLRKAGIDVEVVESGESLNRYKFDLLHFFNLGRPYDLLPYLSRLRVPLVVSSLFVDYFEYDVRGRLWPVRDLLAMLGRDGTEYMKAFIKMVLGQIPVRNQPYLKLGHRESVRRILDNAHCVIATTGSELERIYQYAGTIPLNSEIVPLGIDPLFFSRDFSWHKRRGIISAGRLEGFKNIHSLIKACDTIGADLTISGQKGKNSGFYLKYLQLLAANNVQFTGHLRPEELLIQYLKHRVHAQPSWFETSGLSSLEAAAAGCRVVVTNRGDTAEVFGVYAFYVDPANVSDIASNLMIALETPPAPDQRDFFYEKYNWERSISKLTDIYRKVLNY